MDNLISKGKVVKEWLGVSIQPLTPDLAAQFKLKDDKGILVGDVVEDGPAYNAGIQRGDVIIEFHGKKVEDVTGLRNMVAGTSPGERVNILVVREGKQKSIEVKIEEMSEDEMGTLATAAENRLRGIHVQDITAQMKQSLNIPKRLTGVVVTDIEDDSPSGGVLKRGDLILEINRQPVRNTKDYEAVVTKIKTDDTVLLLIFRQIHFLYHALCEIAYEMRGSPDKSKRKGGELHEKHTNAPHATIKDSRKTASAHSAESASRKCTTNW